LRLAENRNAASIGEKSKDKFVGLTQKSDAFVAFQRDDGDPHAGREVGPTRRSRALVGKSSENRRETGISSARE
jgi:hypothetical protein